MEYREYPIPSHFDPGKVGEVWRVPYQELAQGASKWTLSHKIQPASWDVFKLGLLLIDVQNTFCIPGYALYVGGRSGTGAVEDNRRVCEFIYRNIGIITEITATLDSHDPFQIFQPIFFISDTGEHPNPLTQITTKDVETGKWKINPAIADTLGISLDYLQDHLGHYTNALDSRGKYDLTIWPYHAIQGGIGHALVSAVEEATFFHSICRHARMEIILKGENPLTEHYSAMGPEITTGPKEERIARSSPRFIEKLRDLDALVIAGQAKSHCVAWTINDLLDNLLKRDPHLVKKVYLLEDCTSPVFVPGVVDYTGLADDAFERFAKAGMHIVRSSDKVESWSGIHFGSPE
jgi:nicotinamidase-related amidase